MKQRIFSHFQDYLIQYISHQYQDLLYCNSSQYILSTYNSQHNNDNNVMLAMTTMLAWSLLAQHYYINIEQMINQIKFKSVSMKKDVKIILTAKFLVDIENMFKIQHD